MTQVTRTLAIGAIAVTLAALLPLVLSKYQVGLATEVLIFGILLMSIDILAGFAGRISLGHGKTFTAPSPPQSEFMSSTLAGSSSRA